MSKEEIEQAFKVIYKSWEDWANTGDPEASRQKLIDSLVEIAMVFVDHAKKAGYGDARMLVTEMLDPTGDNIKREYALIEVLRVLNNKQP